jgi:hypothetical protein
MDNINEINLQYEIIERNTKLYNILIVKCDSIRTKMNNLTDDPDRMNILKIRALEYGKLLSISRNITLDANKLIEIFKIPIFIAYTNRFLSEGKSVVIYVNFIESIDKIIERLGIGSGIHNNKTHEENTDTIFNFITDKCRVIICTIRFANIGGFMFADTVNGNFPRAIIIPGIVPLNILHKICREGCKTSTTQIIMFCKETVEETIYNNLKIMNS